MAFVITHLAVSPYIGGFGNLCKCIRVYIIYFLDFGIFAFGLGPSAMHHAWTKTLAILFDMSGDISRMVLRLGEN